MKYAICHMPVCQGSATRVPNSAKECQTVPKSVWGECQGSATRVPNSAKQCQRVPKSVWGSAKGVPSECREPGSAVSRGVSWECRGVPWECRGCRGVPGSVGECRGVPEWQSSLLSLLSLLRLSPYAFEFSLESSLSSLSTPRRLSDDSSDDSNA